MTEPEHDDEVPFSWEGADDAEPDDEPTAKDARRVGLVLAIAALVLVVLVVLLLNALTNVFGDMWNSVFTF